MLRASRVGGGGVPFPGGAGAYWFWPRCPLEARRGRASAQAWPLLVAKGTGA